MYHYNNYFPISDWEIKDAKVFHKFDKYETPFQVLCVQIGERVSVQDSYGIFTETTPIVRWITRTEYDRLLEGEGVVVW